MRSRIALACAALLLCPALQAAPAPWYRWHSKLGSEQPCAQVSPGAGWEKLSGPYRDARCTIAGSPG
jgi:hypothetical protein